MLYRIKLVILRVSIISAINRLFMNISSTNYIIRLDWNYEPQLGSLVFVVETSRLAYTENNIL